MNPAFSVIFFTVLSGAGYGLMIWCAIAMLTGEARSAQLAVALGLILALLLVTTGLISSLAHLGKPARAWRAFSQWRSSWLSREGVMAVVTYAPLLWLLSRPPVPQSLADTLVAIALVICALVTVVCTAMIYASLKPIPAWRHAAVVPAYVLFALLTGGLLWSALLGKPAPLASGVLIALAAVLVVLKWRYWRDIDAPWPVSRGAAVGLPQREVAVFERPHTEANYLTREMGFVLARKHGARLRRTASVLFAAVPTLGLAASLFAPAPTLWFVLAAASAVLGALVERWLFFAQARHMVALYYGLESPR